MVSIRDYQMVSNVFLWMQCIQNDKKVQSLQTCKDWKLRLLLALLWENVVQGPAATGIPGDAGDAESQAPPDGLSQSRFSGMLIRSLGASSTD